MLRGRYGTPCSLVHRAAGYDDVPNYPSKQNVWYYLGERRWSLADDIRTLWDSLGPVVVHRFPLLVPETHAVTWLRLNALLHVRPILSQYHTGLKGESFSNSP